MKHVTLNCHTTSILRRIVKNTYKDMREKQLDSDVRRNAKKILLLREALRFNIFWGKVPKLRERICGSASLIESTCVHQVFNLFN